jgi:hypothetical protein
MSNDFLDACVQVIRCGFGMQPLTTMKSSFRNSLSWALNRRTPMTMQLLVASKPPLAANGATAAPA